MVIRESFAFHWQHRLKNQRSSQYGRKCAPTRFDRSRFSNRPDDVQRRDQSRYRLTFMRDGTNTTPPTRTAHIGSRADVVSSTMFHRQQTFQVPIASRV